MGVIETLPLLAAGVNAMAAGAEGETRREPDGNPCC